MIGGVDDAVTDGALLDPKEFFVEIILPDPNGLTYSTILHVK